MKRSRCAALVLALGLVAIGFTAARADNDGLDIYTYPTLPAFKFKIPDWNWEAATRRWWGAPRGGAIPARIEYLGPPAPASLGRDTTH